MSTDNIPGRPVKADHLFFKRLVLGAVVAVGLGGFNVGVLVGHHYGTHQAIKDLVAYEFTCSTQLTGDPYEK